MKSKRKILSTILIVVMCLTFLGGCGLLGISVQSVEFKFDSLTLQVGDVKDITSTHVKINPSLANNKNFTLQSGNSEILSVSAGNRITAKKVGETTLTVKTEEGGFTDEIPVTVTYGALTGVEVYVSTEQPQYVMRENVVVLRSGDSHAIDFKFRVNSGADPLTQINLLVKDRSGAQNTSTIIASETFTLNVDGQVGEYSLTATATSGDDTYTHTVYVRVYDAISNALVSYDSSALVQNEGEYASVDFILSYDIPEGSPQAVIEWYVSDELKAINSTTFSFRPSKVGKYVVSVFVNGEVISDENGETEFTIIARGSTTPQNVWVDYDNFYPNVFVRWDKIAVGVGYEVKIKNLNTGVIIPDLTTRNISLTDKFTSGSFDATGYIGVKNANFEISVRTLADADGMFTDSEFSQPITFKLDLADDVIDGYLLKKYYSDTRNYYITSQDEIDHLVKHMLLSNGEMDSADVYIAYDYLTDEIRNIANSDSDLDGSTEFALIYRSASVSGISGQYSISKGSVSGKKWTIGAKMSTTTVPEFASTRGQHTEWHAVRPHVNYEQANYRPDSYKFAIDELVGVEVETSDQLYFAVESGYKPLPKQGSSAEIVYDFARDVLRTIITDDMTEVDKAHAIYDFIMWRVRYDYTLLNEITDDSSLMKYASFYLEGVFNGVSNTTYTGAYTYGVCDSMAKAYSLMCNIEGIPCLRIVGTAKGEGHAWNKIKIAGNWYNVDCTWGDMVVEEREVASHVYFMLTDAQILDANSSGQANQRAEQPYANYPKAVTEYDFYSTLTAEYENAVIDFHVDVNNTNSYVSEINTLINYAIDQAEVTQKTFSVGSSNHATLSTASDYFGIDVRVTSSVNYNNQIVAQNVQEVVRNTLTQKSLIEKVKFKVVYDLAGGVNLFVFVPITA